MTTPRTAVAPPEPWRRRPLDRLFDWLLDAGGPMYGDEQERLRWYETTTAAASLQHPLLLWALTVGIWAGGRPLAPFAISLFVLMLLPVLLFAGHLREHRVRVTPDRRSSKFLVALLLGNLPYPLFLLGILRTYAPTGSLAGALLGAVVGGLAGGTAVWLVRRVRGAGRGRSPANLEDTHEDTDEDTDAS